jgi:hypothetical protein
MPSRGGVISVIGAGLLNVSQHGMAIESLVLLETESLHRFRLVIAGRTVDLDARVASCRALPDRGTRRTFAIGVEFLNVPPDIDQQLAAVLESLPDSLENV